MFPSISFDSIGDRKPLHHCSSALEVRNAQPLTAFFQHVINHIFDMPIVRRRPAAAAAAKAKAKAKAKLVKSREKAQEYKTREQLRSSLRSESRKVKRRVIADEAGSLHGGAPGRKLKGQAGRDAKLLMKKPERYWLEFSVGVDDLVQQLKTVEEGSAPDSEDAGQGERGDGRTQSPSSSLPSRSLLQIVATGTASDEVQPAEELQIVQPSVETSHSPTAGSSSPYKRRGVRPYIVSRAIRRKSPASPSCVQEAASASAGSHAGKPAQSASPRWSGATLARKQVASDVAPHLRSLVRIAPAVKPTVMLAPSRASLKAVARTPPKMVRRSSSPVLSSAEESDLDVSAAASKLRGSQFLQDNHPHDG